MDLLNLQPHQVTNGTLGKHFLFYGRPSTRKTTVASNFPKALLLAAEEGYSFIPGVKAQSIKSWYDVRRAVDQLKRPEVREVYDTVALDTTDLIAAMCKKYILNKHGVETLSDVGWGRGWTDYREELTDVFNTIAQHGYGIVFLSHDKTTEDDESGQLTSAKPSIDNTTLQIVNALVDFIFFLNPEEDNEGNSSVFAYSSPNPSIVTKTRLRTLKGRIEFNYENIDAAIRKAMKDLEVEVVDKIDKKPEVKRTLQELKDAILASAQKAADLDLLEKVEEIVLKALGNIPLDEAKDIHYDNLEAILFDIEQLL